MPPAIRRAPVHHPFSPWLARPEQLQRMLVGREKLLCDLLQCVVHTGEGATPNHTLLVGPRGIGKTHILCLLDHYTSGRLKDPPGVEAPIQGWVSVLFTEEEYAGQNSLANLLLTLFQKLVEAQPLEDLWRLPTDLPERDDADVCDCCLDRLSRLHSERGQHLLLLVDNLQKVLQQWTSDEHDRLRASLMGQSPVLLIGTAPSVFREVVGQREAFHQFFDIHILRDLSHGQLLDLMERSFREEGRSEEFESREEELTRKIPAIGLLTGGNPRLAIFLYEIATRTTFIEIETALHGLIEELREYFIRRFDELADQPRKILDTMAQMPGPATPTEIAQAARLPVDSVHEQLRRLKRRHYVQPIKLKRQRATRYDITERLFRIWRQTATVAGRRRFRFLVDFLRLYFTPEEVRSLYSEHARVLGAPGTADREQVIRHVEELYYFQAASEGDVRCDIFSTRVQGLVAIGETEWAQEEAQYFAKEALANGDQHSAATAYRAQSALHISSGQYVEALGDVRALLEVGAHPEAVTVADKVVEGNPDSAEAWELLGVAANNAGEYERGVDAFRRALDLTEATPDLWMLQAVALLNSERWEEAIECARRALDLNPQHARSWECLGIGANGLADYERALEALRKAAELDEPNANLLTVQAFSLTHLDRHGEALRCLEQAVAVKPAHAGAWTQLGIVAGTLGDNKRALTAFRRAAKEAGPTVHLWVCQAIALRNLGRHAEAVECAESAIALDDKSGRAWEELGKAAGNLGEYGRALGAFRKAAELGGATAPLWTYQAAALRELERYRQALGSAESAVELDASYSRAWEELGLAAHALGNCEQAVEAYRRAAQTGASTVRVFSNLAIALNTLRRPEEALECAERALGFDETHVRAWAELGIAAGNLGFHERALQAFRKAAELEQPTANLLANQAIALRNLGREREALECTRGALTAEPGSEWAVLQHVSTLRKLGKLEEAMETLDRALGLTPGGHQLHLERAWTLSDLGLVEDALGAVSSAEKAGASARDVHHGRGDILLLAGSYREAAQHLELGLGADPEDWDLQADHQIALACLGQNGADMEGLPAALVRADIPKHAAAVTCDFVLEVASRALARGEEGMALKLLGAALAMETWRSCDWYGRQVGAFLRRVLD
ncbi:tetratricopeptide repeat protein, partial [Planctomycetota bacterium]